MSKYEFIKTSNIVSKAKEVILEYDENYSGEMKQLKVKVYPYTVEEKLELQNAQKESEVLKAEGKQEEASKILEDATYNSAFYVFRKDDKDITLDIVKLMPVDWLQKIIFKALEFEGISEDKLKAKIEEESSKNLKKEV